MFKWDDKFLVQYRLCGDDECISDVMDKHKLFKLLREDYHADFIGNIVVYRIVGFDEFEQVDIAKDEDLYRAHNCPDRYEDDD